ncbi:hypothetical protein Q8F55_003590 [Vanrija albida]|uniref:Extracellular membrane protein CFEM domain-containing protein n=1 Tax=Vanrija albida TaxID=181172 RepID=A0ABR3Q567_9TREE
MLAHALLTLFVLAGAALASPDRAAVARAQAAVFDGPAAALHRRQSATAPAAAGGSTGPSGIVYATASGTTGEPLECVGTCTTWDAFYTGCVVNNDTASCFGICTPYAWNKVTECFSCQITVKQFNATKIETIKESLQSLAAGCAEGGSPVGSIAPLTSAPGTTNVLSDLTVATPKPGTPTAAASTSHSTNGAVGPGGGIPIVPASTSTSTSQPGVTSKPASGAADDALSLAAVLVVVLASTLVTL